MLPTMLARRLLPAALAFLLAGCAAQMAYREGNELVAQDKVEAGLTKYQEALAADPTNVAYKTAFLRARDAATNRLLPQADRNLADGKADLAVQDYRRVLAIDPLNERARAGLRQVDADRRHGVLMTEARAAIERKDYEAAKTKLSAILTERPTYDPARDLLAVVNEKIEAASPEAALTAAFRSPISLEFRDAPLKQIFEVIARHSGLNFLFDKDVKTDQRASIFLKNSTVEAAVYYLLMTNQLEHQVMDGNTILIYPNIAAKQKEYQEMTVKTFYLANAEAKNIANTLKTILKSRDVVVDEKLNLVILRDTPEAVKVASQLVALQDVPEAEVMLDVEVLEVQRNRLLDLGIDWPTSLAFTPLQTSTGAAITVDQLRHLNGKTIGVTGVAGSLTASKTDGDSDTLAAPRIRVRNKEKAKVVIGDKLPTITTTISSGVGGFASESVNYVDVGLKLDVEPTVYLNNEVGIRISLEVSNLVDTVTTKGGTTAYRIGTRSASTMLQLKDGENQVLAGLIKNEDRSSSTKLPGIGDFPILGRLFGSQQDTRNKTEVVLSITPHLIRNVQRPPASTSEFSAGTEASFRRRPDSGGRGTVQMPGQGVHAAPGARPGAAPVPNAPAPLPVTPAPLPVTPAPVPGAANAPGGMVPATSVGGTATLPSAPPSVPPSDLPVSPPVQITPLPPPDVTPTPQPAPTPAPVPAARAAFPNQQ
ncbi:general secretion pathway protein GspD [Massilia pinisoli]|uniref:General secretion pathway protein GspD n=1 Tax=Massilia pinisoli TaxID=1772194 RepID=A0ABT1ZV65_9BURK|nr:secretin N-terminal domain-containing protein [Massilia pinisoli]MCS0583765.1 general secretion pathway protein GspD [Massilia pinisoli]